jgi:NAD(P)-dependent dehydrogenase (short-subunit alcohol dehydrogenase family)
MMAITTSNGSTKEAGTTLRRQASVLVTGASSGIGFATALRLARHGTIVFAGIRRQVDGENLLREGAGNIRPMLIDVVDQGSLLRARAKIESLREYRLDGLVNNAGVALGGPLELLPVDELRKQFEVNFFGAIAAIQTFLPLLRESGGRIVNVSSIGGKLAAPFMGAYSASKFALEAASDALRLELRPFGVTVSIVEPGSVRTPIWRRSAEASLKIMDDVAAETRSDYDAMIRNVMRLAQRYETNAIPPEQVARVIERALFARRPRARYLVGIDARIRLLVARLPEPLRDLIVMAALGISPKRGERSLPGRLG